MIDKITDKLEHDIVAAKNRLANWENNREEILPIIESLAPLEVDAEMCAWNSQVNLTVIGGKAKLVDVFRILRTAGYKCSDDRPRANDSSWYGTFAKEGRALSFWVRFTSSVCVMVKVGTKTIEEDVYEVRCGEGVGDQMGDTE